MVCKLLITTLAVICVFSEGGFVSISDCMSQCPSVDGSYTECERGCRFYGMSLKYSEWTNERNATMDNCMQDCMEAYDAEVEERQAKTCLLGCNTYDDLIEKAAPQPLVKPEDSGFLGLRPLMTLREVTKTVNGVRMLQTRVVAYFLAGDQLVQVETPAQVFIDMPAGAGGLSESRHDSKEAPAVDEGLWRGAAPEPRGADRVEKVRVLRKDFQHLLAVLSTTLIILLVAFYVLVLYRRSLIRKHKQANLTLAVNHEPLKLVLPEDLTKLSLVEEDEMPAKQGLNLPQAKV